MASFKAIVIPSNRRKDGTYAVVIRLTHNGKSRRIPTNMICRPTDMTRSFRIKNPDILAKADDLIQEMRATLHDVSYFDMEDRDVDWVYSHIKNSLAGKTFKLDFFEWGYSFIKTKKESTAKCYRTSLNQFARFLGTDQLDINDITRSMLIEYLEWVGSQKKMVRQPDGVHQSNIDKRDNGSAARSVGQLQHIYEAAKDKYNDEDSGRIVIPKSPFDKLPKESYMPQGQRNLGVDIIQRLINSDTRDYKVRRAIDTFLVSFGLCGANIADMYSAEPVEKVWVYNRSKTKDRRRDRAEMRVTIPEQLEPYISRLRGEGDHWLNVLSGWKNKNCATYNINKGLRLWCQEEGVQPFTLYAARHTFATLARKCGVDKAVVDECLAHKGDYDITDIYAERNWDLIDDAVQKVMSLFDWE